MMNKTIQSLKQHEAEMFNQLDITDRLLADSNKHLASSITVFDKSSNITLSIPLRSATYTTKVLKVIKDYLQNTIADYEKVIIAASSESK